MKQAFKYLAKALHSDIEVFIGNYPYAAWNSYKDEAQTPPRWYQVPCKFAVILIPESYTEQQKVFSLFHELGHIKDFIDCVEFENAFDNEVSAWKHAYNSLPQMVNGIYLSAEEFKAHCLNCLTTYNSKNEHCLFTAWQKIKGRI